MVSPDSGDGKTFFAANLAVDAGAAGRPHAAGRRRHARPAPARGVRPRQQRRPVGHPVAAAPTAQVIQQVPGVPSLFVLPVGITPPNPLELVERPAFGLLMRELAAKFDHVVVDTPAARLRRRRRRDRRALRRGAGGRAQGRQRASSALQDLVASVRRQPGQAGRRRLQRVLNVTRAARRRSGDGMPTGARPAHVRPSGFALSLPLHGRVLGWLRCVFVTVPDLLGLAAHDLGHRRAGPRPDHPGASALAAVPASAHDAGGAAPQPAAVAGLAAACVCAVLLYAFGRSQVIVDARGRLADPAAGWRCCCCSSARAALRLAWFPLFFLIFMVPAARARWSARCHGAAEVAPSRPWPASLLYAAGLPGGPHRRHPDGRASTSCWWPTPAPA